MLPGSVRTCVQRDGGATFQQTQLNDPAVVGRQVRTERSKRHGRAGMGRPTKREALMEVEPMTGIEPAYSAWEADVLPLNYIGVWLDRLAGPRRVADQGGGVLRGPHPV